MVGWSGLGRKRFIIVQLFLTVVVVVVVYSRFLFSFWYNNNNNNNNNKFKSLTHRHDEQPAAVNRPISVSCLSAYISLNLFCYVCRCATASFTESILKKKKIPVWYFPLLNIKTSYVVVYMKSRLQRLFEREKLSVFINNIHDIPRLMRW